MLCTLLGDREQTQLILHLIPQPVSNVQWSFDDKCDLAFTAVKRKHL